MHHNLSATSHAFPQHQDVAIESPQPYSNRLVIKILMPLRNHLGGLAKKRSEKSYQPASISLKTEASISIIFLSSSLSWP